VEPPMSLFSIESLHVHVNISASFVQALIKEIHKMSELTDQLVAAVTNVGNRIDALGVTLNDELVQINAALAVAGDSDLKTAVTDSVQRLTVMATALDTTSDAIKNIIP
jgi:hypothetical protein